MRLWHLHTLSKTGGELTVLPTIHKCSLVSVFHFFMMQQLRRPRLSFSKPYFPKVNPHIIFQCYKNLLALSRLKGTALCLLKTKYAIKPKNPV
jgi:hypothetical protein